MPAPRIDSPHRNPDDCSSRIFCGKITIICGVLLLLCIEHLTIDSCETAASVQEIQLDQPVPKRLVGREFTQKIASRLNLIRSDAELLKTVEDLQRTQNIAIVLDRRIDPNQKVSLNVSGISIRDVISQIAQRTSNLESKSNDVRIIGDTVVVGPKESLSKFRTLVHLRTEELRKLPNRSTRTLQEITDKETVHWNDLDRPIDVLEKLAAANFVKIANPQTMRHDLWRGGTMFNVNFIEAATCILLQYDLMFEWNNDATEITLLALPEAVGIIEKHRSRKVSPAEAVTIIQKRWPKLKADIVQSEVSVFATVEQQAVISELMRSGEWPEANEAKPANKANQPNTIPLAKRNISLRVIRKPVSTVLATLIKSGINIQYDPTALKTAGIDLSANIDLDVKNADIDELMSAICKPVGMKFRIEGEIIHLMPE